LNWRFLPFSKTNIMREAERRRSTDSHSPVSLSQNLFPIFDSRNRRFEMKNRETHPLMQNSQVLHHARNRRNLRLYVMQKSDAHPARFSWAESPSQRPMALMQSFDFRVTPSKQ